MSKAKYSICNFLFEYQGYGVDVRIKLIATFCLLNILLLLGDVNNVFGYGYIDYEINEVFGNYILNVNNIFILGEYFEITHANTLLCVLFIYILSLLFVIFDFGQLFFSLLSWLIHLSFINSSQLFSYGADYFVSFLLFMNVLFILSSNISSGGRKHIVMSIIIRLMQVHLSIAYFFTGFGKIMGKDWLDGKAMYIVLNNSFPSLFQYIDYLFIYQIIGWSVVILELFYPLLVAFNQTRKITIYLIITMHIGIFIFLDLYTFGMVMILANIIVFYEYLIPKSYGKYKIFTFLNPIRLWK